MPDREKVIKSLEEHLHCSGRGKSGYCPYSDDELWNDISDALALLRDQPDIVYCKDCKYVYHVGDGELYCNFFDVMPDQYGFCAEGVAVLPAVAPVQEIIGDSIRYYCGHCGEEIFYGYAECENCGRDIDWDE